MSLVLHLNDLHPNEKFHAMHLSSMLVRVNQPKANNLNMVDQPLTTVMSGADTSTWCKEDIPQQLCGCIQIHVA